MTDKVAIVTGASSGIGTVIAKNLAQRGLHVVLACRDVGKARALQPVLGGTTTVLEVDTSSQRSVGEFVAAFRAKFDRLDVLVNNAGIQQLERRLSIDRIEIVFATNVIGYHQLTRELREVLVACAPARIVNVASTFAGGLDLDDLAFVKRRYDNIAVYKQSKQANRMLSWAWARRLEGARVTVNACNPGLVMTGLYRDMSLSGRIFMNVLGLFTGVSVEAGADTAVWLATDPALDGVTGRFFAKRKQLACEFANEADEEKLFAACDGMLERN